MVINTASTPAELVRAHALEAGPPFLPPRWLYSPWRWRDEHTQRTTYYDGTPVAGPFNSEIMEDVLMMQAFGIPNGVYWIDRPWGVGKPWGYDDFEIPIFVRVGSTLDLGDLSREWADAQRIARERPDLKAIEADVTRWFAGRSGHSQ